jgi:hypothetical protein
MEQPFKIRSYGYGELALLYFPNSTKKSASTQLGRWLRQNNILKEKLLISGLKRGTKLLTPNQVKIIFEFIGEP